MVALWALVSAGETYLAEHDAKRIRFWVDMAVFTEARTTGHPAFASPFFEPWEVLEVMKFAAATMNADHAAQQQMIRRA